MKSYGKLDQSFKTGVLMKRKMILQLFAEETATTETTTGMKAELTDANDEKPAKEPKGEQKAKYTDADVDELISKKFAEWSKKQDKAVAEAKKLAEMNAQEKAEYERDQLKKELDDLKKQASLAEMTKTARKMLTDGGININDELLSMMVTTDAAETKAAVDGFAKMFNEAVENAVKERLKGEPPRKGAGGVASMTKEQIMAIKDPELRQKKMIENKHLFNWG